MHQSYKNKKFLGFPNAMRGMGLMFQNERNFKIQFAAFCIALFFGFLFRITATEWLGVLLISGLVLTLEIINSSLEKTCDLVTIEQDERIRNIKDISASAVFLASIFAIVVGMVIFVPYFLNSF